MISGSCDTEDWSNCCRKNYMLKIYIKTEKSYFKLQYSNKPTLVIMFTQLILLNYDINY